MILVLAFLASMIPGAALFLWLYKQKDMQLEYRNTCKRALIHGMVCVAVVILFSAAFSLIGNLLGYKDWNVFLSQGYYNFVILAFSEELVKFLALRRIVSRGTFSWPEVTIIMVLVGLGFEVVEAIPYAVGAGPAVMFVRGVTVMHAAFGFVMGYFYGKSLNTGKKVYAIIGFVLVWVMHGTYDFMIADKILGINENLGLISMLLAAFSIVLIVLFIRYVVKNRKTLTGGEQ